MIVTETNIVAPWVAQKCEAPLVQACTAIGLVQGGRLVAGVMYDHFTGRSIQATIAIDSIKPSRKFWWAIFDYPFNQLGFEKIIVRISTKNSRSMALASRLGFTLEGYIQGVYDDGSDMLIATMTRDNCKWLGVKHGIEIKGTESA